MSYLWVFTVVNASQLLPSKSKQRQPIIKGKLVTLDGKEEHEISSPPGSSTSPEWNFKMYQFPAANVLGKYDCIKFVIRDKSGDYLGDSKIRWDFIGEPPKEKSYTLRISSRKKNSSNQIGGLLRVHTVFQSYRSESIPKSPTPELRNSPKPRSRASSSVGSPANRLSRRADVTAQKLQQNGSFEFRSSPGTSATEIALHKGTRVQFSAAGRREIQIPTSGVEKFITYGELPEFEIIDYDPAVYKKKAGGEKFGFNLNNALWLVTCATLAYKNEEIIYDVCRNVWDMKGAVFLSHMPTDTQGFCMHDDRICVICFRGTESLRDWMTNLNCILISGNYPERYIQEGMRVHQGFYEAITGVWDQVEDFVDSAYHKFPDLKLYICGHSLGGALANLCHSLYTLSDSPRHVSGVYTIGQPRVGNRKFKQLLEKSSPNTVYIRMTNNQDVVPNLAAGQHVGTHVHINALRRFSFKPPAWKKAMNEITSIQGSGKDLQYYGIADHSGPVYRTIIEENWSRFTVLQTTAESANVVGLGETSLLIVDMITENVKGVRRYKPQFRAVVAYVIKIKPLIDAATDYVVIMRQDQQIKTEQMLSAINTQLAFLHHEMVARRKEKSILQRRSKHESAFNSKLERFCIEMQNQCQLLHELLSELNESFSGDISARFGFNITRYDEALFDISFHTINFTDLSNKALATRRTRDHAADIGLMLESAEEMIDEGELEMALQFLNKMPTTPQVQKYMTDEQKATHSFLTAKCHAKLHHHTEAMAALKQLATNSAATGDLIDDEDFEELATRDQKQFHHIACTLRNVKRAPAEYEIKLKKNEIAILSSVFDEYDEEGDGYLTTENFNKMIDTVGIENLLFQMGWKSPKAVPQIFTIIKSIDNDFHGTVNIEQYLNLMSSLLPSETQNIGSSAARREQNARKGPAVWDMFSQSV